jgi:heme-degrading monooxygenase HmoA
MRVKTQRKRLRKPGSGSLMRETIRRVGRPPRTSSETRCSSHNGFRESQRFVVRPAQSNPELPGFISASILCRSHERGAEFLVFTNWRSLCDLAGFAGTDLEAAVVPATVAAMMVEYDDRARQFEVIE